MIALLLCSLSLNTVIGPEIDYFSGTSINPQSLEILPTARYLNDLADSWMVQVVGLQNGTGGVALFDPYGISGHGRSPYQTHFFLNDIDISDPGKPGEPLFELPYAAWQEIKFDSFWHTSPGFTWQLKPTRRNLLGLKAGYGQPAGNQNWMPPGVFDRDPATCCGANTTRRNLKQAQEFSAQTYLGTERKSIFLLGEFLSHQHLYPTLNDQNEKPIHENAGRLSLLKQMAFLWGEQPWLLSGIWQKDNRGHAGAQFRWLLNDTRPTTTQSAHLQLESTFNLDKNIQSNLSMGFSYKESTAQKLQTNLIKSLNDEWLWLARPTWPEFMQRQKIQIKLLTEKKTKNGSLELSVHAKQSHITTKPRIGSGINASTFFDANNIEQAHAMTVHTSTKRYENILREVLVHMEKSKETTDYKWTLRLGLNHSSTHAAEDTTLNFFTPTFGAHYEKPFQKRHRLFFVLRHEALKITNQIATFVNTDAPTYNTYRWNDDGDLLPNLNERGDLLQRRGGAYHEIDPGLIRPFEDRLALGAVWHNLGPFTFSAAALGRMVHQNFTVRFDQNTAQTYTPTTIIDPGGDGRGEDRIADESREIEVYERSGKEGQENYILTNAQSFNFFTGTELQLYTEINAFWFMNLSATGYWSIGNAPFGSFPDRNEPGLIHEDSANPNKRINQRGRFDHDRSFGINLLTGVEPIKGLTSALVLRYRDGQPFVRTLVVEGLAQGPETIMAVSRGAARHTFHMGVDIRLRYRYTVKGYHLTTSLDFFNVLGSGTEILEDSRTSSNFRRSLEMVPGRSAFLQLSFN